MLRAAIIGATGVVGQQFVVALQRHPWFKLTVLAASERSAGKSYKDALTSARGQFQWYCDEACEPDVLNMPVLEASQLDGTEADIFFSGLETDAARELEPKYARHAAVISTTSSTCRNCDSSSEIECTVKVSRCDFDSIEYNSIL